MKKTLIIALAALTILCLVAPAGAQNVAQKCSNIQINVDVNTGGSNWSNDVAILKLLEAGGGWVVASGDHRGQHFSATKGQKIRFNFNDGNNHPVDVAASSKAGGLNVRGGSTGAIVLVDVTGGTGALAIHFDITGAKSEKAKINDCPGGNTYVDVE